MLLYVQLHKVVINYCFVHKRNTKNKNTEKVLYLHAIPSLLLTFSGYNRLMHQYLTLLRQDVTHIGKKHEMKNLHPLYTRIKTHHFRQLGSEKYWGNILRLATYSDI